MNTDKNKPDRLYRTQQGFTLIELMVAMLIGLIVVAAAGGIFLSNSRVFRTTESVGRIQENIRASFEMLSRDIREASATPCGDVQNLQGGGDLSRFLKRGVSSSSGSVLDVYIGNQYVSEVASHVNAAAPVSLVAANGNYAVGDALMICNGDIGIVFNVKNINGAVLTPQHPLKNASGANWCFWRPASGAAWSSDCGMNGASLAYVSKPVRYRWQIKGNGRGSTSLYRQAARFTSAGNFVDIGSAAEVAENVTQMSLAFRRKSDATFQTGYGAWGDDDWRKVVAVQVKLKVLGNNDERGTDGNILSREVTTIIALRNREES